MTTNKDKPGQDDFDRILQEMHDDGSTWARVQRLVDLGRQLEVELRRMRELVAAPDDELDAVYTWICTHGIYAVDHNERMEATHRLSKLTNTVKMLNKELADAREANAQLQQTIDHFHARSTENIEARCDEYAKGLPGTLLPDEADEDSLRTGRTIFHDGIMEGIERSGVLIAELRKERDDALRTAATAVEEYRNSVIAKLQAARDKLLYGGT